MRRLAVIRLVARWSVFVVVLTPTAGCRRERSHGNKPPQGGSAHTPIDAPVALDRAGITGGSIRRVVEVFVQDEQQTPIIGADVAVDKGTISLRGRTDRAGYVRLEHPGLEGAVTVTASAVGRGAVTWYGVKGRRSTLVLEGTPARSPPFVFIIGGIEGWDALPKPGPDWWYEAEVRHTQRWELGSYRAFEPEQRDVPGYARMEENRCVRTMTVSDCAWSLKVPAGRFLLAATITKRSKGKPSSIVAMAISERLSVETGTRRIMLHQLPRESMANLELYVSDGAPPDLDFPSFTLWIDLEALGRLEVASYRRINASFEVPRLKGVLEGGRYLLVDRLQPVRTRYPFAVRTHPPADKLEWELRDPLPPPRGLTAEQDVYAFQPVAGADAYAGHVSGKGPGWSFVILDGTARVEPPALALEMLPHGHLKFTLNAVAETPHDPVEYRQEEAPTWSSNQLSFDRP